MSHFNSDLRFIHIDSVKYMHLSLTNPEYIKIQGNNILNIINEMDYIKEECWLYGTEDLDIATGLAIGLNPLFCKNLRKKDEKKNIYSFVFNYKKENDNLLYELKRFQNIIDSNENISKYNSDRYKEIIQTLNQRKIKIPFQTCFIYVEDPIIDDNKDIQYTEDMNEETQIKAIKRNSFNIKYIKNPTRKVQMMAVSKFGFEIEYI